MNYEEEAAQSTTDDFRKELEDLSLFRTSYWVAVVKELCNRVDKMEETLHQDTQIIYSEHEYFQKFP